MIGAFVPFDLLPAPKFGSRSPWIGYVICENGCWEWTGQRGNKGYARVWLNGERESVSASRFFYEHYRETIPVGLVLDHLCRNRPCVNPWHLEPVTTQENIWRGEGVCAQRHRQSVCIRGHELTKHFTGGRWRRTCTTCSGKNL